MKSAEDFLFLFGADLAALAAALEKVFDFPQADVDELLLDVIDEGLEAGLSGHLGDSRAHGTGAEDGNFFGWVGHILCFAFVGLHVSSLAMVDYSFFTTNDMKSTKFFWRVLSAP